MVSFVRTYIFARKKVTVNAFSSTFLVTDSNSIWWVYTYRFANEGSTPKLIHVRIVYFTYKKHRRQTSKKDRADFSTRHFSSYLTVVTIVFCIPTLNLNVNLVLSLITTESTILLNTNGSNVSNEIPPSINLLISLILSSIT